jgi:hypothetical protein
MLLARVTKRQRKNKARTFALDAQDPRGQNPGDLYRYTLDLGRSLRDWGSRWRQGAAKKVLK